MKDIIFDEFQNTAQSSLLRHKSILDIISKFSESNARVNRAIIKAVTNCGCVQISAKKQCIPSDETNLDALKNCFEAHLEGKLCDNCREIIENEIGNHLFYLTSLCNTLNLSLFDILLLENQKINTLGNFSFR